MFFGKSERKRGSALPIIIVGALAVVGAVSITKKGKSVIKSAGTKIKHLMGKDQMSMCDF